MPDFENYWEELDQNNRTIQIAVRKFFGKIELSVITRKGHRKKLLIGM